MASASVLSSASCRAAQPPAETDPLLIVLVALALAADAGGIGRIAALTAAGFWVLLSVNLGLQKGSGPEFLTGVGAIHP